MTKKEQREANAKIMGQHIMAYRASGLSVLQYCKNNNLSVHRFNYWLYRRGEKLASTRHKGFSRVTPPDKQLPAAVRSSVHPTAEVLLANGTRVAFFEANALDLFKALL